MTAAVTQRCIRLSQSLLLRSRSMISKQTPLRTLRGQRHTACGFSRTFSSSTGTLRSEDKVTVHFINRDGENITTEGKIGDSLLDVVVNKNLDIDGFGACEGTLACSTCHLIFDENIFKQLDPVTDEEMDMLDLAYGLTETLAHIIFQWENLANPWKLIFTTLTFGLPDLPFKVNERYDSISAGGCG